MEIVALATAVRTVPSSADLRAAVPYTGGEQRVEPRGFTRRAVLNVLEAFFSRPILSLLPLILLAALGVVRAVSTPEEYRSIGTLRTTSGSLIADLTQTGAQPGGYETQAVVTSRNINDVLRTDTFLDEVIDAARLRTAVDSGQLTEDEIRASIAAGPSGDNLVSIVVTSPRPEQSQLVSQAVVDRFVQYVVDSDVVQLQARVDWYEEQLSRYEDDLDLATKDYDDYMGANPIADEDDRPFDQQLAIERLEEGLSRATTLWQETRTQLDQAELALTTAGTLVTTQLSVVDEPTLPTEPMPRMKEAAMTFIMFTMLGAILSVAFVVLRAFLDRTVRVADDITAKFGLDVIAIVPPGRR